MKIETVLFDIGAVLIGLDFNRLFEKLKIPNASGTDEAITRLNQWKEYDLFERGKLTPKQFYDWAVEHTKSSLTEPAFWSAWNSILLDPLPGIPELIEKLSSRYPLYALTNANQIHYQCVMQEYPIFRKFRRVFSSHQLSLRKPEPEIYTKLLTKIPHKAEAILFVDDRMENVEGARSAGYNAEHCPNSPTDLIKILNKYNILD
jgi:glucose-1-phosphatase